MDDSLLRGNRTVKVNSGGLDAFSSPNFPPLAMLETGIRFRPSSILDPPKGRFVVHGELETNIAVWRSEWRGEGRGHRWTADCGARSVVWGEC